MNKSQTSAASLPSNGPLIDKSRPEYDEVCQTCGQRRWAPCFDQRVRGTRFLAKPHKGRGATPPKQTKPSSEPIDLLAALQRSLDAAKTVTPPEGQPS